MQQLRRRWQKLALALALLSILFLENVSAFEGEDVAAVSLPSEPPEGSVRVAGIVLKWLRTDKDANFRRAEKLIREAADHGAQFVCTTECFLDGYAIADKSIPLEKFRALGEKIPEGKYFKKLSALADELDIQLVAGLLEADGEQRFNTSVLIDANGKLVGRYHKQRLGHEKERNTPGKQSSVYQTKFGKVGMMICADRRDPTLVSKYCQQGADFLICPSGGMFGSKRNDPIVQARSRENRRYVVFVHPAEFLVTGPDGSILKRTILGDKLFIGHDEVGKVADSNRVFYFDLPLTEARKAFQPVAQGVDLLIRNGMIIDGTGIPRRKADLAIAAGRIVAIGDLAETKANKVIDATGMVVCPGFIDLHSHADRGILKYRSAENYIRQGATTLVCGNCGSSPTNLKTFFDQVREAGAGPNVVMLIGHGSVRQKVMGLINRPPTAEELDKMKSLVRQAMKDGAIGLSTSLRYGAGVFATTDEVAALAREVTPFGGFYVTHMRDEGTRILEAIEEALVIGEQAKIPVHISHHKISSASVFGLTRQTLARIDELRSAGKDVTLDQYPYGAGSGGMHIYVPQWSLSGGMDDFRKRLTEPETKARILAGVEELLIRKIYEADHQPDDPQDTAKAFSRIRVARAKHDESLEGKTLTQILRDRDVSVTMSNGCELLVELISHGTGGINHTLEDRPGGDVDRVMLHPQTCVASDGSVFEFGTGNPHPRSYGCYPRVLGHYVRERKLLTLEQAIHKMTVLPAKRLGWTKRGRLEPGCWADVVVFNAETITDNATFTKPHQHSTGIHHVIVNGRLVLAEGKMTEERPGGPLSLGD